jgi:hypothetical protein
MLSASIATLFPTDPYAMLSDLTEACPLIRAELNVKTHDGGQSLYGLVDGDVTLYLVLEDFASRFP